MVRWLTKMEQGCGGATAPQSFRKGVEPKVRPEIVVNGVFTCRAEARAGESVAQRGSVARSVAVAKAASPYLPASHTGGERRRRPHLTSGNLVLMLPNAKDSATALRTAFQLASAGEVSRLGRPWGVHIWGKGVSSGYNGQRDSERHDSVPVTGCQRCCGPTRQQADTTLGKVGVRAYHARKGSLVIAAVLQRPPSNALDPSPAPPHHVDRRVHVCRLVHGALAPPADDSQGGGVGDHQAVVPQKLDAAGADRGSDQQGRWAPAWATWQGKPRRCEVPTVPRVAPCNTALAALHRAPCALQTTAVGSLTSTVKLPEAERGSCCPL